MARSKQEVLIALPRDVSRMGEELREWEQKLAELTSLKGTTDDETYQKLAVGTTEGWELRSVVYQGRQCYSGWGVIQILGARVPEANNICMRHEMRPPPTYMIHLS